MGKQRIKRPMTQTKLLKHFWLITTYICNVKKDKEHAAALAQDAQHPKLEKNKTALLSKDLRNQHSKEKRTKKEKTDSSTKDASRKYYAEEGWTLQKEEEAPKYANTGQHTRIKWRKGSSSSGCDWSNSTT